MKNKKELLKQNLSPADKATMNKSKHIFAGFTLAELMVVIVITAILTTLGVKSYQTIMANSQATQLATALNASLRLAKNEAIHRNTNVIICATYAIGGLDCEDSAGTWQYGWMVWTQSGEVLQVYQVGKSVPVVSANLPSSIMYSPSGFPDHDFTFTIQPEGCDRGYQISAAVQQGNGEALQTEIIGCP